MYNTESDKYYLKEKMGQVYKRVKYFSFLGLLAVWFAALWTIHSGGNIS